MGLEGDAVIRAGALLILVLAFGVQAQRPAATPAQEWRTYDHDLAGTRFSPLTEINAGNVAKLAKAWTYGDYYNGTNMAGVSVSFQLRK